MKFVVDCMLGKLAKWLKILGFDVLYFSKIEDEEILNIAKKQKRALLTRDNYLIKKAKGIPNLFIESENWPEQVIQVINSFNLREKIKPYSRCIECNYPLKKIKKERAKNLVAPFIYENENEFALCPKCGRIYWPGTHYRKMQGNIKNLLKGSS